MSSEWTSRSCARGKITSFIEKENARWPRRRLRTHHSFYVCRLHGGYRDVEHWRETLVAMLRHSLRTLLSRALGVEQTARGRRAPKNRAALSSSLHAVPQNIRMRALAQWDLLMCSVLQDVCKKPRLQQWMYHRHLSIRCRQPLKAPSAKLNVLDISNVLPRSILAMG
ncbi:hypothetical protein MRB53_038147 [Persea americana]|nr:hypothetical protein MRB53_038147 [Persea americana]